MHRSEFDDGKYLASEAWALLSEQYRPSHGHKNTDGYQNHHKPEEQQNEERSDNIDETLHSQVHG
jgi:hypothetical protein